MKAKQVVDAQSKLLKEFESKDKKFKNESDALKNKKLNLLQKKTLSSEDYIKKLVL